LCDAILAGDVKSFFSGPNYVDGIDFVMEDVDAEMLFRDDVSYEARAARENIVD